MTAASPDTLGWAFRALAPPPDMSVWEWADAERVLPPTSAIKGLYRSDLAPYWREPAEFFDPADPCSEMVVMKGARTGASVALAENVIGYHIAHDPCPIVLIRPTVSDAESNVKARIRPMFDTTPALAEVVGGKQGSRKGEQTLHMVTFPGGIFYTFGSNAPTDLRGKDAKIVIFDEADAAPAEAGEEGDPFRLAIVRSRTFPGHKALMFSTPTVKGRSRIEKAYLASTQGHYHVPCPHCGALQWLWWGDKDSPGGVKWDGVDEHGAPVNVHYRCEHCGEAIREHHKPAMVSLGEWGEDYPGRRVRGRHLSALYSLLNFTWHEAVVMFLEAGDDPMKLKVFVNTVLAETFDADDYNRPRADDLMALRERWWAGDGDEPVVPARAGIVTAFVDVQGDRLEFLARAWGAGEESWTIDRRVIPGDPSAPGVWADLDRIRSRTYLHESGVRLPISAMGVDSGYLAPVVYAYCGPRESSRVWATKGTAGANRRPWPTRPRRATKARDCFIYSTGIDPVKTLEMRRLRAAIRAHGEGKARAGAGVMHFPAADWCDADYFAQLTAENRRKVKSGGRYVERWDLPNGRRNEILDLHVGTYCVLQGLVMLGVDLDAAVKSAAAGPAKVEAEPAPKRKHGGMSFGTPRGFGRR